MAPCGLGANQKTKPLLFQPLHLLYFCESQTWSKFLVFELFPFRFFAELDRLCQANRKGSCRKSWSMFRRWSRTKRYRESDWHWTVLAIHGLCWVMLLIVYSFPLENSLWRIPSPKCQRPGHGCVKPVVMPTDSASPQRPASTMFPASHTNWLFFLIVQM